MTFQLPHFVSATCGGETCFCGKAATHKLGEEIPHDQPCMTCGETWRYASAGGKREVSDPGLCKAMYHHARGAHRHNLTAYVCCFHWTLVLGSATGCPLTDVEAHALAAYKYAFSDVRDPGFGPPNDTLCLACGGKLTATGKNIAGTIMFLDCATCGSCSEAPYKEEP